MDPTCGNLRSIVARAGGSWTDELEHSLDDVEMYLGVQLERLEDMEPGGMPEVRRTELMRGLEMLTAVCEKVREGDREVHAEIDRAEALLGGAP